MADYNGKLKDISALDLGAIASRAAMERAGVLPTPSTTLSSATSCRPAPTPSTARVTSRSTPGVPVEVPALTVNRLCGSGIQAAVNGAQLIQLDEADLVLTGGVESMSQAPHVIRGLRSGLRLGQGDLEDSLWAALLDTHCGCTMAATAENCAAKYNVSRDEQDRVRPAQSAARRQGVAGRAVYRGSRPGRDQVAQGCRDVRPG